MYWWVIVQDKSQFIIRRFSSQRYAGIYASAWDSPETQVRIFKPDEEQEVAEELRGKLGTATADTEQVDGLSENQTREVQL